MYEGKDESLFKMIDHITYLTKNPVVIRYNRILRNVQPPKAIMVSPLLFRSDFYCQCGTCCKLKL